MDSRTVLLIACYELGHQPLSLAWPTAVLRQQGHSVTAVDLAVSPFPPQTASEAAFVGIAVPMHAALRLGVRVARQVRRLNPQAHICFYGLYAWLNATYLLKTAVADSVIAGEVEQPLVELVETFLAKGDITAVAGVSTSNHISQPHLTRLTFPTPDRSDLPALIHYAHYRENNTYHLAGYTEASRGCRHTCHHCPVVPVYNGRFFVIPVPTVMADIRQQVAVGARHVTLGDPDFLNGPKHALHVARALHQEFPHLTFDFTTKVEHILKHHTLFAEFRALGASFVVSAFESVSDRVLRHLQKGHTAQDLDLALAILGRASLPVQPTLVAFTPWTTLNDYLDLLTWIRQRQLMAHIPTVQLAVRLLVPPGSALLQQPDTRHWLGSLDAANFIYAWRHPDPRMDELHTAVTALAEQGDNPPATFAAIERLACNLADRPVLDWLPPIIRELAVPPRLTENWFC